MNADLLLEAARWLISNEPSVDADEMEVRFHESYGDWYSIDRFDIPEHLREAVDELVGFRVMDNAREVWMPRPRDPGEPLGTWGALSRAMRDLYDAEGERVGRDMVAALSRVLWGESAGSPPRTPPARLSLPTGRQDGVDSGG